MIDVSSNFSGRMLFRLVVLGVLVLAALFYNLTFIDELYFTGQLTPAGLFINGGILAIFLLGLLKIVALLLRYRGEEKALAKVAERVERNHAKPLKGISPKTLIAQRYTTLESLGAVHAKINHSALAAILLASENTRISFARYVSNILILTGVFGTIVSLSIALAGASNLLEDIQGSGNMGLVIHGMSTALSTTMTAILCYLFYGYFFLKLTDAQSHLLGNLEAVTSVYLLPKYSSDSETMLHEVSGLIQGLREAAVGMQSVQQDFAAAGSNLHKIIEGLVQRSDRTSEEIHELKRILRDGFRLPAVGE